MCIQHNHTLAKIKPKKRMHSLEERAPQRGLSLGGEKGEFFCTFVFSNFLSYRAVVGLTWKATQAEELVFNFVLKKKFFTGKQDR